MNKLWGDYRKATEGAGPRGLLVGVMALVVAESERVLTGRFLGGLVAGTMVLAGVVSFGLTRSLFVEDEVSGGPPPQMSAFQAPFD